MRFILALFFSVLCVTAQQKCQQSTSKFNYPCPPFPDQGQNAPGIEANMTPRPDFGNETYVGSGKLNGKVALITGGDSGIGRAVALAFAREGADVAISYLNEDVDALETKSLIEAAGRKAIIFPGCITNETHIKYIIDTVVSAWGRIDILVNNAAAQGRRANDFDDFTHDRVMYTYQVNIIAMFDFVRYVLPYMAPGSSIINTASIQAYQPSWQILDYATTKGAIVSLTKGLSQYSIAKGVRTNTVAPGPVWTPLIVISYPPEEVATFGSENPMGRPAQPAELASAYVYLASDESSFTNGEIIGVTGGEILN